MSSKSAAARASRELLMAFLRSLIDGTDIEIDKKSYGRKLHYAKKMKYIRRDESRYVVTTHGKKAFAEMAILNFEIHVPKRWDGKWRLVIFDVPEVMRRERAALRRRLQDLNLCLYKESVWIFPYPLEREIRQIADHYGLTKYISFVVAESISDESLLRKKYKLI